MTERDNFEQRQPLHFSPIVLPLEVPSFVLQKECCLVSGRHSNPLPPPQKYGQLGRGCCTVVEHTPRNLEAVGSILVGCWAFSFCSFPIVVELRGSDSCLMVRAICFNLRDLSSILANCSVNKTTCRTFFAKFGPKSKIRFSENVHC